NIFTLTIGNGREPTWGVSSGDTFNFKLDICRTNGAITNANFVLYEDWSLWENNSEFLQSQIIAYEGDIWTTTISATNTTGIFGTVTLGDRTSSVFQFWEFFVDTHSDNSSFWIDRIQAMNDGKNSTVFSSEEYELNGNIYREHGVYRPEYADWLQEWTYEFDIAKGVVLLSEYIYNSSSDVATYHGNDHQKFTNTTLKGGLSTPSFDYIISILALFIVLPVVIKNKKNRMS
ncbi:MAG: hypothetical protein ACW964_17920, partial [Candidatus Hodarchaeales archaeon]